MTTTTTSIPNGVVLDSNEANTNIHVHDSRGNKLGRVYWNQYAGRWYIARQHLGTNSHDYMWDYTRDAALTKLIKHQTLFRLTGEYP